MLSVKAMRPIYLGKITPTTKKQFRKVQNKQPEAKTDNLTASIPGLQHVFDTHSNWAFKFLWVIIVGVSFGTCLYQIGDRFQLFLSCPIESRSVLQTNSSLKFPSITICPNTHVVFVALKEAYYNAHNKTANIKGGICYINNYMFIKQAKNITQFWNMMSIDSLIFEYKTYSRSVTHQFDQLAKKIIPTFWGNCATISIEELIPFKGGGEYFVQMKFLQVKHDCNGMSAMYSVHMDDEDVTFKISNSYSLVVSNMYIVYGLSVKEVRLLNRPEAPCESDGSVVRQCEKRCIEERLVKENISCKLPFFPDFDLPDCNNFRAAREACDIALSVGSTIDYSKDCACLPRCHKTIYFKNLITVGKSEPRLEFYYEDNFVERIEEFYSYTFIAFICDIGGNVGLFLGLCVPAMLDILQSFIIVSYKKVMSVN